MRNFYIYVEAVETSQNYRDFFIDPTPVSLHLLKVYSASLCLHFRAIPPDLATFQYLMKISCDEAILVSIYEYSSKNSFKWCPVVNTTYSLSLE